MKIIPLRKEINVRHVARYAVLVNTVQIAAVWALAALLFAENSRFDSALTALVALLVSLGALLDIREALAARRKSEEAETLGDMVGQLDSLNRALRAQRHDFLNHLQVVFSLIEMQEYQEAGDYIERVYGDIQSVSRAMRTDNPALNALLRAKLSDCERQGIAAELDVSGSWRELPLPAWELCRVLSNLIDNACDALAGQNGALVRITLREDVRGFAFAVANNGPMIPPESRERIFEAGFSSRGEGRGMGLYIVRKTLAAYGGSIAVESDGAATVFHGLIPRGKEPHDGQKAQGA